MSDMYSPLEERIFLSTWYLSQCNTHTSFCIMSVP